MALHDIDLDRPRAFDLTMLKDDKEEDLVGLDLHQLAIRALHDGLWVAGPHRGLPWHVSTQLVVVMRRIPGKARRWRPSPDILVHPTAGDDLLTFLNVDARGVPPFMIEVASPSTWTNDVRDKRFGYELSLIHI